MAKHDRRSPSSYTQEDRIAAKADLDNDAKVLISIRSACIMMDISVPTGYEWARQNILPGAVSLNTKTAKVVKVNRTILRDFLYNKPHNEGAGDATQPQPQGA